MAKSLAFVSTGVAAGLQLSMSALQELVSVLPLMKEEAIRTAHHLDTEEVVQRTQVLDGELSAKTSRELTEETSRTCRQDDVIDIEQQVGHV